MICPSPFPGMGCVCPSLFRWSRCCSACPHAPAMSALLPWGPAVLRLSEGLRWPCPRCSWSEWPQEPPSASTGWKRRVNTATLNLGWVTHVAPSPRGPWQDGAPGVHPGNLLISNPPVSFLPSHLPHFLTFASREHLPNESLAPNPHLNSACWRIQLKTSEMMGASPGCEGGCEGGFEKQGT